MENFDMTMHTTTAPEGKSPLERLNLEMMSSDLDIALTFVEAAAHFAQNLCTLAGASNTSIAGVFKPDAEHASNMIAEIGCRVRDAKEQLDAFIDAVPVSHLSAERKAA
jgi:hypothetical protein